MQDALNLIDAELSRCLREYPGIIARAPKDLESQVREELNHRYFCLQTCAWIIDQKRSMPKNTKTDEEVIAALIRWQKDIQRNSTVKTMHQDARVIARLQDVVDHLKPITAHPEQKKLF